MPRNKNKAGQEAEAKATVRAWAVKRQEVATIVHRVMLAEDVDKVGVEARATAEALVAKNAKVAVKTKALAEARDEVKV